MQIPAQRQADILEVRMQGRVYSHGPWAVLGGVHSAPVGHKLQHFLVAAAGIGHVAQREDLPQQHAKRPARGQQSAVGGAEEGGGGRRGGVCEGSHHVSVLDVKIPSMKASGGIHLTGSIARPPFR